MSTSCTWKVWVAIHGFMVTVHLHSLFHVLQIRSVTGKVQSTPVRNIGAGPPNRRELMRFDEQSQPTPNRTDHDSYIANESDRQELLLRYTLFSHCCQWLEAILLVIKDHDCFNTNHVLSYFITFWCKLSELIAIFSMVMILEDLRC